MFLGLRRQGLGASQRARCSAASAPPAGIGVIGIDAARSQGSAWPGPKGDRGAADVLRPVTKQKNSYYRYELYDASVRRCCTDSGARALTGALRIETVSFSKLATCIQSLQDANMSV